MAQPAFQKPFEIGRHLLGLFDRLSVGTFPTRILKAGLLPTGWHQRESSAHADRYDRRNADLDHSPSFEWDLLGSKQPYCDKQRPAKRMKHPITIGKIGKNNCYP